MTNLKTGDKVKQAFVPGGVAYPEYSDEIFTILKITEGQPYSILATCEQAELEDIDDGLLFKASEVEPVGDFHPVGSRVVCVNGSRYHERVGTIVSNTQVNSFGCRYLVHWDGQEEPVDYETEQNNGGTWSDASIKLLEEEKVQHDEIIEKLKRENQALRAAASDAGWAFRYYAQQHSAKNTPDSSYKAMFNLMLADRMDDALKTDS